MLPNLLLLCLLVGCAPGTVGGLLAGPASDSADPGADSGGDSGGGPGTGADAGLGSLPDGGPAIDGAPADEGPPGLEPDGSVGTADIEWPQEALLPGVFQTPTHVGVVADDSITVSWRSATEVAGVLRYHTGSQAERTLSTPPGTEHHVTIEGLHPGAGYRYEVEVDGAVREGVFVTPGVPAVRMTHLGEFHAPSHSADAAAFADVLRGFRPHLLVESGDMVDSGEDMNHWTDYLRTSAPWISNSLLLPAHSNHVGNGEGIDHMVEQFDLPDARLYYSTRFGHVQVLTIRSEWFDQFDAQTAWIREQAELAHDGVDDPAFLIATWHHPACSSNYASRAESRERVIEDIVEPLIEGGGVDLILVAHDKYYERSLIDGEIVHVMTNIGNLSPGDPGNNHPRCTTQATDLDEQSTLLLDASAFLLHGRAVRSDGSMIDEFQIAR